MIRSIFFCGFIATVENIILFIYSL